MEGWIKINRGLLDWEWFDEPDMVRAWIWMLFTANIEDRDYHGITLKRGQFMTSLSDMSERLNLSIRRCRTILTRLKSTHEVTLKQTHKYTIVTICKYDTYQDQNLDSDTLNDTLNDTQATHCKEKKKSNTKENKEEQEYKETITKVIVKKKNEDEIKDREQRFRDGLKQYSNLYPPDMIQEFADYWTERNPNGFKMRFEKQETWDTSRRLARWQKNNSRNGNSNYHTNISTQRDTFASQSELDHRDYTSTIDVPGL